MALQEDFNQIIDYAHFWNWAPDWGEVQRIYEKFPDSFSVLTPFAYSYLEELPVKKTGRDQTEPKLFRGIENRISGRLRIVPDLLEVHIWKPVVYTGVFQSVV